MADKNRRGANVPEPLLACAQAEVHILQISAVEMFGQQTDRIQTSTGHIETESNSTWNIDDMACIDVRGDAIGPLHVRAGA